jgi:transcription factor STE12
VSTGNHAALSVGRKGPDGTKLTIQASSYQPGTLSSPDPHLNRFLLPNGEHVSCIFWNGLYHITGTDIGASLRKDEANDSVRALVFRFEAFSRPVKNVKK